MALTIERWMKLAVHTVKPRDSVAHARTLIEEHRVNQLPVVQAGRLVGIVTDRDLRDAPRAVEIAAVAASGHHGKADPDKIPVETVMSTNVITLRPTDTIEEAARVMRRERYGALPIVEKGVLRGILARSDLLEVLLDLCTRLQEKGIEL
ncbi:MAG TPA: CBS domain-containing protein [Candidatus Binataceae bacterium]|nr:CBS domain-containing protein [Candidatus Binataceae bacterium]